jgi:hypothetical protein
MVQLNNNSVAASNMPTAEQIHSILDHHRSASLSSGPSLLTALYRDIPLFASAWGVGKLGLPFTEAGAVSLLGLQLPFSADSIFTASLRYAGSLQLRIDALSSSDAEAAQTAQKLSALLGLFQTLQPMQARNQDDAAVISVISSIKIDHQNDHAVLTATIPMDLLRSLTGAKE